MCPLRSNPSCPALLFEDVHAGVDPGVLLSSALATAVQSCREALMSCIMAVRRDGGMREECGVETRSLPAPRCCAAHTLGFNAEPPAACTQHI